MPFHELLRTLRRRNFATLLVILTALGAAVGSQKLTPTAPTGQATAQILVDARSDAMSSTHIKEAPLATRAQMLAQVMASDALLQMMSRDAGIPRSEITSEGPYNAPALALNAVTPSEARGPQLLSNAALYRLTFLPQPGVPIVTVTAQGPTAPAAARLVGAVAVATQQYLGQLARQDGTPSPPVVVRQLGPAQEGAIGGGRKLLMGVTGVGVLLIGLMAVLGVDALRRRPRAANADDAWSHAPATAPATK